MRAGTQVICPSTGKSLDRFWALHLAAQLISSRNPLLRKSNLSSAFKLIEGRAFTTQRFFIPFFRMV